MMGKLGILFCTLATIVVAGPLNLTWIQENEETKSPTIARLNYWRLSESLVSDRDLQEKLGIKQDQVVAIRKTRERVEQENLFEEQLGLLLEKNGPDHSQYEPDSIWLSLDHVILSELEKILDNKRLVELRQTELRRLYRRSFEYFRDPQILKFIELNDKEREGISQKVKATESSYAISLKAFELEHGNRVFKEFSPDSMEKFAEYAGNHFDPGITIGNSLDLDQLPYSWECKTEEIPKVLNEPGFLERTKISTQQKTSIENAVKSIYGNHLLVKDSSEMLKRLRVKQKECSESIKSLLNQEQYVVLIRAAAASEFARNTELQLRRNDVLKYLEIEQSELANLRRIAAQSSKEMKARVDALNRTSFEELANSLAPVPRKRLLGLFLGSW